MEVNKTQCYEHTRKKKKPLTSLEWFQQGRSCNSQSLKLMKGISRANAATRPRTMVVSQTEQIPFVSHT